MEKEILDFISRFSSFGNNVVKCFKERNCYYFYNILKTKFINAEAYYDKENDHVITKIDGNYYDVNGRYNTNSNNIIPYEELNSTFKKQLE